MISKEDISEIKKILDSCHRPMYFFDDDPDGLSSFLIFYRYMRVGQGMPVKSSPELKGEYARKVEDYNPDLIIVLDKPMISKEFFDAVDVPILWIDHHEIQKDKITKENIYYFNSRTTKNGYGEPTSYICYSVLKDERPEDLWIAMTGFVGDWFLPEKEILSEFQRRYPKLLSEIVDTPQKALYEHKIGSLVQIFSFMQKGTMSDVKKNVKILTRIESPSEILDGESSAGRLLYKFYNDRKKEYDSLMNSALLNVTDSRLFIFRYKESANSYTSDISNELLYRYPDKVIIIAREKSGEMRMSLRSSSVKISSILEESLKGLEGYGGGHEFACGCNVKEKDFSIFLKQFEEQINLKVNKKN